MRCYRQCDELDNKNCNSSCLPLSKIVCSEMDIRSVPLCFVFWTLKMRVDTSRDHFVDVLKYIIY